MTGDRTRAAGRAGFVVILGGHHTENQRNSLLCMFGTSVHRVARGWSNKRPRCGLIDLTLNRSRH
jgi:hypothetical protein